MTKVRYSPAILDVRALSLNTLFNRGAYSLPDEGRILRRAATVAARHQTEISANSNAPSIVNVAPTV